MSGAEAHLDRTGENLAKYLQFISREHPNGFQQMLSRIAKKIPGISKISSIEAPDKRLLLAFHTDGYTEPFFQQDMSDGTLKMLAYLLLMEDPEPAPLVGIEEPEIVAHVVALKPGHPYLRLPLQFSVALESRLLETVSEDELAALRREAESELGEPGRWGTTFTLIQSWGSV